MKKLLVGLNILTGYLRIEQSKRGFMPFAGQPNNIINPTFAHNEYGIQHLFRDDIQCTHFKSLHQHRVIVINAINLNKISLRDLFAQLVTLYIAS